MSRNVFTGVVVLALVAGSPIGFARYKVHAALDDYKEAIEERQTTCTDDMYDIFRKQGSISVYNALCGPRGSVNEGSFNEQRNEASDVVYDYYELALYSRDKKDALISVALAEGFVEAHCFRPLTKRLVCNMMKTELKTAQLQLELAD